MKYHILLLFIPLFYTCNSEEKVESPFLIKEIDVYLNDTISNCYKVNGGYICETINRKLKFLNNNFEIDTQLTTKIKPTFDLVHTLSINDTIFGLQWKNDKRNIYFLNNNFDWLSIENYNYTLYEDEKYSVKECCIGEFGGSVFFKEKSTKRVFSCPATCVVSLNKIDGIYYLINSLEHLRGHSEILKIDNPSKLFELTTDSLKNDCNWWVRHKLYPNDKAIFRKGTETIFESNDLILASFIKNETFYHINQTEGKTYISTFENNHLNPIDSFSNSLFIDYSNFKTTQNGFIYNFKNNEYCGFIELEMDTLKLILFKKAEKIERF